MEPNEVNESLGKAEVGEPYDFSSDSQFPEDLKPTTAERPWWKGLVAALALAFVLVGVIWGIADVVGAKPKMPDGGDVTRNPSVGLKIDDNAKEGSIKLKTQEEIQEELNRKVEEGMINIKANTNPIFEDGASPGSWLIENSTRNIHPQMIYVQIKETNEEIYRSGAIPVGSHVDYAPLDVDLDAGNYDCVMFFNNVNIETGEILGTACAEIVVSVLN